MKRNISKNMSREQIVASMAKKLAENGNSEIILKKKKSNMHIYYILMAVIGVVFLVTVIVSFNKKDDIIHENKETQKTVTDNPVIKLKKAYTENKISENQYAIYLKDLMVRYDSLPQKYKVPTPVISDKEVFSELSFIWPKLSLNIRLELVKAIPGIEQKIETK